MKSRPKAGTTGELNFTVAQEHVIDFATDGMPAVLATPRLISTEGETATFHVEARDEHEVIARGTHKRGIIRVESFAKRVARKTRTNA